jgi:1-acyl-sn-glycerol-3-phosphate acyltransferase
MIKLTNPIKIARAAGRFTGLSLNAISLYWKACKIGNECGLPEKKYGRLAELSRHYAIKICRSHGLRVHMKGKPLDSAAIYVANHLGYIDPLLIVSQAPMFTVSKMEIAGWPILGNAMNASGALFVKRGDIHNAACLLRRAVKLLRSGVSILNFPEGTTTSGKGVLPFHRGFFGIARLIDIPVVPVCIEYLDMSLSWYGDAMFFPHYLKTASKRTIEAQLTFGDPVLPKQFDSPKIMAEHCRRTILEIQQKNQRPVFDTCYAGCGIKTAYRINSPITV